MVLLTMYYIRPLLYDIVNVNITLYELSLLLYNLFRFASKIKRNRFILMKMMII